jgi:hypothetical protein
MGWDVMGNSVFTRMARSFGGDAGRISLFTLKAWSLMSTVMLVAMLPIMSATRFFSDTFFLDGTESGSSSMHSDSVFSLFRSPFFDNSLSISFIVIVLSIIIAFPYAYAQMSARSELIGILRGSHKRALAMVVTTLVVIGFCSAAVAFGLNWLIKNAPFLSVLLIPGLLLFGVTVAGVLLWDIISAIGPPVRDWLRLRRNHPTLPTSRRQIAETLTQFASSSGRAEYIRWLSSRVSELDPKLRDPNDRWPNNDRPNYGNDDEASTLLARLDERWLGLSR